MTKKTPREIYHELLLEEAENLVRELKSLIFPLVDVQKLEVITFVIARLETTKQTIEDRINKIKND